MISFRNGEMFVEDVKVLDIANKYKTATFIYSKNQIIYNFNLYKQSFKTHSREGLICFACKANSNLSVLKILSSKGSGADTVSGGEIFRCLEAGFAPQKIVYAGVGKTAEEIEFALKKKIFMFNVESLEELYAIDKIARRLKVKANIAFRINPEVSADTHAHIATGKKGTKFGIDYKEAVQVYMFAKKCKNILPIGIHSHIGSQILDIAPYEAAAAKKIKAIVDELSKCGIDIQYINCGGGLGVEYKAGQKAPSPDKLMSAVSKIFDSGKKIIFEPGRSIIANAGFLLTKIIYCKKSGGKNFAIVDAGMNDLIRPSLYEAYHEIVPVKKTPGAKQRVDIVGPICETGDFLALDRLMPPLKSGQYLMVYCAGAYGASMASEYNLRPALAQVLVDKNKTTLIKKRGAYKELK